MVDVDGGPVDEKMLAKHNPENLQHNAGSVAPEQHKFPCRNRKRDGDCKLRATEDYNEIDWPCTRSEPCKDADPPWGRDAVKLYRWSSGSVLDWPGYNAHQPCGWREKKR